MEQIEQLLQKEQIVAEVQLAYWKKMIEVAEMQSAYWSIKIKTANIEQEKVKST